MTILIISPSQLKDPFDEKEKKKREKREEGEGKEEEKDREKDEALVQGLFPFSSNMWGQVSELRGSAV